MLVMTRVLGASRAPRQLSVSCATNANSGVLAPADSAFPLYSPSSRRTVRIMATSPIFLAAFGFGGMELLIVLLIVLVLFGGAKLPSLAKGLGQSIKEFKKASKDDDEAKNGDPDAKKPEVTKTHGTN